VKADQKSRNRSLGGDAPFGYRVEAEYDAAGKRKGGRLVEEPEQQKAIRQMTDMRNAGHSLRAIAAAMQAQGHKLSHVAVKQAIERSPVSARAPQHRRELG
jgi:hypothetical protein